MSDKEGGEEEEVRFCIFLRLGCGGDGMGDYEETVGIAFVIVQKYFSRLVSVFFRG